jgi:hypothetical protein
MPLFQDLDITFRLDELEVIEHSDRFFGEVEPYVVAVFFKIDGEGYNAFLRIANTQPPLEGTTQVVETSEVQLQLLSVPDDQEPFIAFAPGAILRGESLAGGETMDVSDIAFATTLQPVPLVIDVLGIADLRDILEGLSDVVLDALLGGEDVSLLNLVFDTFSEVVADLVGLDEDVDACPPGDEDLGEFMDAIEAEFNALIPGTVGGVFQMMENDDYDEDDVTAIRDAVRDLIAQTINDVTNSVTRVNPIPDADSVDVNEDEAFWAIAGALFLRFDPVFWFVAIVGVLWAANDDSVGDPVVRQFDHTTIDAGGETFSNTRAQDDNRWRLRGAVDVG